MKTFLVVVVALLTVFRSPQPIESVDVVHIKSASAVQLGPEARTNSNDSASAAATVKSSKSTADNDTTPCDRHLRSTEVEVRNPRNHKFVTSNGWTDRQRPRPEINVYSRIEESPSPPPVPAAATSYYQQQRDNFYHNARQQQLQQLQPTVRTSKRIIYYATLPDVVRPPAGYPPPPPYSADSLGIGGPGSFPADFRQVDSNRNGPTSADHFGQRNRLAPYENAYNRGGSGVTSVTSKSSAVYNSRYDEPAEFRDPFFRNNEFSSKFSNWAEPFYKSWTSSPPLWERDPITRFSSWSPFSWEREGQLSGGGGGSGGGGPLDNRVSSSWENRGSSWDKELVEVPLQQKPTDGSRGDIDDDGGGGSDNKFGPEVAVVKSGVIDVRSSPPPPVSRFTIVDVDPKPYPQRPEHLLPPSMRFDERRDPIVHQPHPNMMRFDERRDHQMIHNQQQPNMRYDPMSQQQKPMRYETYTPIQPPTRYEHDMQPPYMQHRYEQQYRAPPPSSSSSSSSSQYGQHNQDKQPSKSYYETSKNNVNTHQFMTSWTEVSTHDDVSPTHSVNLDISSIGNSTSVHNNTRIVPYTNSTKMPK